MIFRVLVCSASCNLVLHYGLICLCKKKTLFSLMFVIAGFHYFTLRYECLWCLFISAFKFNDKNIQ